jgi:hypothetical protein
MIATRKADRNAADADGSGLVSAGGGVSVDYARRLAACTGMCFVCTIDALGLKACHEETKE